MARVAPAQLVLLAGLPPPALSPPTLRLVARVIALDTTHSIILVADQGTALLVDIALAVGTSHKVGLQYGGHPPPLKALVMLTGELCFNIPRVKLLEYETSMKIGIIDESRILRARVIKECEQLDLEAWRTMVKAGNQP